MLPRQRNTRSGVPSMNMRRIRHQGESELWLNAVERAFLKPHTGVATKVRNTLLRA